VDPNTLAAEGQSRHHPDRFESAPVRVSEFTMHGPYRTVYSNWIRRLEIVLPEWIVFQHGTHAEDPRMFVGTFRTRQIQT
jgi:hypothetical protein